MRHHRIHIYHTNGASLPSASSAMGWFFGCRHLYLDNAVKNAVNGKDILLMPWEPEQEFIVARAMDQC